MAQQGKNENLASRKKVTPVAVDLMTAACAIGEKGGFHVFPTNPLELHQSTSLCNGGCPLIESCLKGGMEGGETGVYGGVYLISGTAVPNNTVFQGRRGIRTQTEEEMFTEGECARRSYMDDLFDEIEQEDWESLPELNYCPVMWMDDYIEKAEQEDWDSFPDD